MTNPYYNHVSGNPVALSRGVSASMRSEFDLVQTGFDMVSTMFSGYAPLASPGFAGTPTAATAAPGTNTAQLATTAFVASSFAPLASPSFTGTPLAPTAAPGTSSTQLATTAFVATGYALLASPTFTGTPSGPTAAPGTSNTQFATTAFVAGVAFSSVLPGISGGTAGMVTTNNGAAAAWAAVANTPFANISGTTQTAVAGGAYLFTNVAASTVTLPASPSANDKVIVKVGNGLVTNVINPNGATIEGISGNMTIDNAAAVVKLQFLNSSWRLV